MQKNLLIQLKKPIINHHGKCFIGNKLSVSIITCAIDTCSKVCRYPLTLSTNTIEPGFYIEVDKNAGTYNTGEWKAKEKKPFQCAFGEYKSDTVPTTPCNVCPRGWLSSDSSFDPPSDNKDVEGGADCKECDIDQKYVLIDIANTASYCKNCSNDTWAVNQNCSKCDSFAKYDFTQDTQSLVLRVNGNPRILTIDFNCPDIESCKNSFANIEFDDEGKLDSISNIKVVGENLDFTNETIAVDKEMSGIEASALFFNVRQYYRKGYANPEDYSCTGNNDRPLKFQKCGFGTFSDDFSTKCRTCPSGFFSNSP